MKHFTGQIQSACLVALIAITALLIFNQKASAQISFSDNAESGSIGTKWTMSHAGDFAYSNTAGHVIAGAYSIDQVTGTGTNTDYLYTALGTNINLNAATTTWQMDLAYYLKGPTGSANYYLYYLVSDNSALGGGAEHGYAVGIDGVNSKSGNFDIDLFLVNGATRTQIADISTQLEGSAKSGIFPFGTGDAGSDSIANVGVVISRSTSGVWTLQCDTMVTNFTNLCTAVTVTDNTYNSFTTCYSGLYYFYNAAGGGFGMDNISISQVIAPTISVSPTSTAICSGGSGTALTASCNTNCSGITYSWSPGGATASAITANPGSTTTYTVTGTNSSGGSATATSVVTVNASVTPSVSISASPSGAICANTSVTYTAAPANGGASPSYQWYYNSVAVGTNSATYTSIPSNSGDNITCTMTSNAACPSPATVNSNTITVIISSSLSPTISPASPVICSGGTVILDAGSGYYSYIWSNSGSTNLAVTETYSASAAGTYTVTVANASGCTGTASVTVAAGSNPTTPAISGSLIFCAGSSTILSTGSYSSYLWSPGNQTTSSITVSASGSNPYSVTVTSGSGCTASASVTATGDNPSPIITGASGLCSVPSTTLGTSVSYSSYSWSTTATTSSISVSSNGTYSVTVTDGNGCSGTATASVSFNPSPIVTDSSNVICNGSQTGVATAVAIGGTAPYAYLWSNGATTATITGLTIPNNYTVTVTDANGCTATFKKLIDFWSFDNTAPNTGLGGVNDSPMPADYSSNGGATITFNQILTPSRDSIIDNGSPGSGVNKRTGYTYENGVDTNFFVRTRNPDNEDTLKFYIPTTGYKNIVLSFAEELSSAGKGVNNYSYSTNGGSSWLTTGLAATTYTPGTTWGPVTVNLTGISGVDNNPNFEFAIINSVVAASGNTRYDNVALEGDSVVSGNPSSGVLIAPPLFTITASGPTIFCAGGSVTLTAPAGIIYSWSDGENTQAITVSTSGTYSLTEVIGEGCNATSNAVTVTVIPIANPGTPVFNLGSTFSRCTAAGTVTYTATSAGSASISYSLDATSLAAGNTINPATGAVTYTAVYSGTSVITATALSPTCGSSTATHTVTITQYVTPSVSIAASPSGTICAGTSVTFTATPTNGGSPSYQWFYNDVAVGTNSATYITTPSNNGDSVTCTMTTSLPCVTTGSANSNQVTIAIAGSLIPAITPASPALCPGGTESLDAGAGYTSYIWSNSGSTNLAITETYSASATGTYSVTVTNASGCSGTASVTVAASSSPTTPAISGSLSFCTGSSTTLSTGTYSSYLWSNGATASSITVSAIGSYSVTVGNASGCSASSSPVTVTQNPSPTPTIYGATSFCPGTSTTLDPGPADGSGNYTAFSWSNSATTETITVSTAGTYSVTITNQYNCTATASAAVTLLPAPIVTDSSSNVSCNGGSNGVAAAVVTGGAAPYDLLWSNGTEYYDSYDTIAGLPAGNYTVFVTDNNGCTAGFKNLIHYWTFDNTSPHSGNGGVNVSPVTADYSTIGGASIVFNQVLTPTRDSILDNGSGGSNQNLRTGYTASPYGNNYVRTRNPSNEELLKFVMPTTGYQNLVLSYAAELSSSGKAVNTYSYSVDGIHFETDSLPAATYTPGTTWGVQTINLSGISRANNNPNFVFAIGNSVNTTGGNARYDNVTLEGDSIITGFAGSSIIITQPAAITGDTTATTCGSFTWHGTTYNSSGNETWIGTSASGCDSTVTLNLSITSSVTNVTNASSCVPYTWAANNQIYSTGGAYVYINGCIIDSLYLTINASGTLLLTDSSSNGCNGANNGYAVAVVSGGTSPYTYIWSNTATTSSVTGLGAGSYSVTVTDNKGCTATFKKLIDYWSFDNTTPLGGAGGIALNNLIPDYAATGGAQITFNQIISPSRDSILDNGNGGSGLNERTGYNQSDYGNNYIRTRNPNNEDTLKLYMPTTGYQNIVLSFAAQLSGSSKELLEYIYSLDGGTTWTQNGLASALGSVYYKPTSSSSIFSLETINLSSITAVNNNANFVFGILDTVTTQTSGNCRFDNVTLEGDIIGGGVGSSVTISNPDAINTTISGLTEYCQGSYTVLSAPDAGLTYLWSGGQSIKLTQQTDTIKTAATYSVTITNSNGCSATSSGITVSQNTPATPTISGNEPICAGSSEILTASAGSTYLWSTGATTSSISVSTAGPYTVTETNSFGCTSTSAPASVTITGPCTVAVNLSMFIQGYYQGGGKMTHVLYNEGVDPNQGSTNVDTITVNLVDSVLLANDPHDNSTDADTVATAKGVLQTNGSLTVTFPGSVVGHKYYLMVTHRNAVQTWSAYTLLISDGLNYDFTSNPNAAYGNNEVANGDGTYSFYSGDINQSGGIDAFDFLVLDPDILAGNGGYLVTDLNGSGGVDALDFLVLDPNIIGAIGSSHP